MWRSQKSYLPIVEPSIESNDHHDFTRPCCCSSNGLVQHRYLLRVHNVVSRVLSSVFICVCWCYKCWFCSTVLSKLASDLRIAFIMVAVYTSLVSHVNSTAAIEAERDVSSRSNFTINANWTNEQISGGISDPVLWGCRHYSTTKHYYRILYGILLCAYLTAVIFYMLTRSIVSCLSFNAYCQLERGDGKGYFLNVAHSLKLILSFEYRLENPDDGVVTSEILKDISDCWKRRGVSPRSKIWVFFVFYFIPMLETVLSLLVVIAIILSYDLHPIVCLSGMFRSDVASITYDPVEYSVVLLFPSWAKVFQKSIITISVGFLLMFAILKVVEERIQI